MYNLLQRGENKNRAKVKCFALTIVITIVAFNNRTFSQKPLIDTAITGKWPFVASPLISNNGEYVSYTIENLPEDQSTLVLQSTIGNWKREFVGGVPILFSCNNDFFYYSFLGNIYVIGLKSDSVKVVSDIKSFKGVVNNSGGWLIYQFLNGNLCLKNICSGIEYSVPNVDRYILGKAGRSLAYSRKQIKDGLSKSEVGYINLTNMANVTIWRKGHSTPNLIELNNLILNDNDSAIAFVEVEGKNKHRSIWYYRVGDDSAKILVSDSTLLSSFNLTIEGGITFDKKSRWLFFNLQKVDSIVVKDNSLPKVDIWSYKDVFLNPDQLTIFKRGNEKFLTAINLYNNNLVRIQHKLIDVETPPKLLSNDYVIILENYKPGIPNEWRPRKMRSSFFVLNLSNNSKRLLNQPNTQYSYFSYSPNGKFVVYYDLGLDAYFCYDIKQEKSINITKSIPKSFKNNEILGLESPLTIPVAPVVAWSLNDSSIMIYDNYDIWQVDVGGIKKSINLTNGFGFRNHIKLRLLDFNENENIPIIFNGNDSFILVGLNQKNMYNGFFRKSTNQRSDPEILTMGPYTYYKTPSQKKHSYSFDDGMIPLKALNSDCWIVKRQSAIEAPNYYFTTDFKIFRQLSNLHPQLKYNWLTSELITWRQFDGTYSQGVLYKPENFDPKRKYPVIFNYYHKLSHRLYEFPYPEYTGANIDIAWFVSNGYLVFNPDINFSSAYLSNKTSGEWAYNSVISAANYLEKFPFIDKNRMGLQGHSFGGLLTCYLGTHSNKFAAVAEVAGSTDPISAYLTLVPFIGEEDHFSKQYLIEFGHEVYGSNPWIRPDLYRRNSAVLNANKVSAPFLIMHNKKDNQVQWRQGVELYMALRRLQKPVWLLQYDNSGHFAAGVDAKDYAIRLSQFFDHYLRNLPQPRWMSEGVPAMKKGTDLGYERDNGNKP